MSACTFIAEYVLDSTRLLGTRALNVCCRRAERTRVEMGLAIALAARRVGGGANSVAMPSIRRVREAGLSVLESGLANRSDLELSSNVRQHFSNDHVVLTCRKCSFSWTASLLEQLRLAVRACRRPLGSGRRPQPYKRWWFRRGQEYSGRRG